MRKNKAKSTEQAFFNFDSNQNIAKKEKIKIVEVKVNSEKKIPEKNEDISPKVFTITEINYSANNLLETAYADIWVTGEISGFQKRGNGFLYFTLKDDKSQLSVIMFPKETKQISFKMENGLEIVCHGKLSIYPAGGRYQIIGDRCEPKGKGALQLAFEQLKERLQKEGLFALERKRSLPFLPKRIGVVTSPTGAAVRDIIDKIRERAPLVSILLAPARVQGPGAAIEIAEAIRILDEQDIDLMIVGRGGGSQEDLWAFNEEIVAKAIFASKHPVISAVGHEVDVSISDFVADASAITPTAAAEMAVPNIKELLQRIMVSRERLIQNLVKWVELRREKIIHLERRLGDPRIRLNDLFLNIANLSDRLGRAVQISLERKKHVLQRFSDAIQKLSPFSVLERGYSIVVKAGKVINNSSKLSKDDDIEIQFAKGKVLANISKLIK